MATRELLLGIPTDVLRKLASERGIPSSGSVETLRSRIASALTDAELSADQLVSGYTSTRATQNYRFYALAPPSPDRAAIAERLRLAGDSDPFAVRQRPPLKETPAVTFAELLNESSLAIDIAFRGDPRPIQVDWEIVEARPPIFARIVYHAAENLVEVRGPRQKILVIENWLIELLGTALTQLRFSYDEAMQIRALLHGTTYSVGRRPRAGSLGLVRITSADTASDVESDPEAAEIADVLSRVGGADSTAPTLIFWQRAKVRANEKEGSFYIPRQVSEDELAEFRGAALRVKQLPAVVRPPAAPRSQSRNGTARHRELLPEAIQAKIATITWLSEEQATRLLGFFRRLSLGQQQRLATAAFTEIVGVSQGDLERLAHALVRCGLLVGFDEYYCSTCGVVTDVLEDVCTECGDGSGVRCQMYKVRGFIQPALNPDSVFRPDYRKLRQLHDRLLESRVNGSNDEKKKALEGYMEDLFSQIDGSKCVAMCLSTRNGPL